MAWKLIDRSDTDSIRAAIALLQRTSPGYGTMDDRLLKRKMKPPNNDANDPNANTNHHCLRLYNYVDQSTLLVSAFLFLRRRKKKGNSDPKVQWAGTMTVGAEDMGAAGGLGLSVSALTTELDGVCKMVKLLAPNLALEVMHLPPTPSFNPNNLKQVYTNLRATVSPTAPRLEDLGTIRLGYPWVPKDINGNEVEYDFVRLNIVTT